MENGKEINNENMRYLCASVCNSICLEWHTTRDNVKCLQAFTVLSALSMFLVAGNVFLSSKST